MNTSNNDYITKEFLPTLVTKIIEISEEKKFQFIFLKGPIGVGKTTFVKEFALQIGEEREVKSPSFNYIEVYEDFVHIDGYNLKNFAIDEFVDYFEDKTIIIEWPENLIHNIKKYMTLQIDFGSDNNERKYHLFLFEN